MLNAFTKKLYISDKIEDKTILKKVFSNKLFLKKYYY
jgi:hypothetical protein